MEGSGGAGVSGGGTDAGDLRVVQLLGLPGGTSKASVRTWVEEHLPGGCGIEDVRRNISDSGSATQAMYLVSFRKEQNARRALEVLQGSKFEGHEVSAGFRALERSRHTAKAGRLIIRNLAFDAREKHIRKAFEKIGELIEVHLPEKSGAAPGQHRGFGFLQYSDTALAERAMAELNGTKICGRGVAVDWSVHSQLYGSLQREEQHQQPLQKQKSAPMKESSKQAKRKKEAGGDDDDAEDEEEEEGESDEEAEEEEDDDAKPPQKLDAKKELSRMKDLLGDEIEDDEDDKEDDDDEDGEDDEEDEDEPSKKKSAKKDAAVVQKKPGFDVDDGMTLFIRNVPFDADDQDLRTTFMKFGKVKSVKLVKDPSGENKHRGTAFVKFCEVDGAKAALSAEAEAERKLKELSAVTKKSDRRELPVVEGFGISLKGRRLVVKPAVAPDQVKEIIEDRKPNKETKKLEKRQWAHLLHVGEIKEGTDEWQKLSTSEQRQRQAGAKERKFRINNPNFTLDPLRLSFRNLPPSVGAQQLREAIVKHLCAKGDASQSKKKKANRCSDRHHERASLPRRRASQCQQRKTITWFWLHDLQGQSDSLAGGGLLEQQPQGLRRPTTTHRGVCDRGQKKIEDAAGTLQKTCTQGAGRQRHRRRQGEGQGQRNGRGRRGSGSCRCCRSHEEEENQKEEKC